MLAPPFKKFLLIYGEWNDMSDDVMDIMAYIPSTDHLSDVIVEDLDQK